MFDIEAQGNHTIKAGGTGSYNIEGKVGTTTLDYSADASGVTINLATDTVFKDILFVGNPLKGIPASYWQDNFTNIQNFVGGGSGSTTFQSVATGFYTFNGKGTNNTLDYSADTNGVTINLATDTVFKDILFVGNPLKGIPASFWQDSFTDIQNFVGGSGNNTFIIGASGNDLLTGGAVANDFVFETAALAAAQAATPSFVSITNFDQGNGGSFNAAQGDQIDLSTLLATAYNHGTGKPVSSLVHVNEDASGTFALLQVDPDGTGTNWTTIAQLNGIVAGNSINVILDSSLPAGTTISANTTVQTTVQQEILGLYAALYNRATDFNGVTYWAGVVGQQPDGSGVTAANAGTTAITVNDATVLGQQFVNTQNTYFNATYGSLSDSDFITALYTNLAGNATNIATGISYWANLLQTAEAAGQSVQSARAGLVGQIVHDMIDFNVSVMLPGYTTAQWQAVVQREETIDNKIAVSLAYSNASQGPGGSILVAHTVGDAAFQAATTILQGITYDPATVTTAITGINNAVAHQDLSLI